MKRCVDILFSSIGLLILWPVFLIVAILIKLDSRGSVFFKQERIGKGFKPFTMYTFRTIVEKVAESGLGLTLNSDNSVTTIGRFLRQTKIEKLPLLINVLKGDMGFVGPRPEVKSYVNKYKEAYKNILTIRPGITDLASIKYPGNSSLSTQKKIRLAEDYVENASVFYDVGLVFSTMSVIIYPGRKIETLLASMTRHRLLVIALVQGILIALANFLAFYIRFEGNIPANYYYLFVYTLPMLVALRFIFFYLFSLFQGLWRFISIKDMKSIFFAITLASVSFFILLRGGLGVTSYPRSIYIIDWLLAMMLLGGIRFARRVHNDLKSEDRDSTRRVLVVGAGDAAEKVLREIVNVPNFHYNVIGLIDDTPGKQGLRIHNVPVLGTISDLREIISRKSPDEILVAIPSAPLNILRQITKECKRFGKPIKVIPGLREMLFGKNLPILTRNIEPEDLLFREHVKVDISSLKHFFQGKRVMITGVGGTIGSEISGQIAKCKPACLILFERHEESLYNIEKGLRGSHSEFQIHPIIGDVTDAQRVAEVMAETRPQILFHAAANKHVPMMELNPSEAIKTNILGTKIVAEAASRSSVEVFVLVSTDKAVDAVSIMGASKRVAELTMQGLNGSSNTRFVTVRFGNVIASSGSVVPLFKEQIKKGGPLTVTHPDIVRYFMTTTEAVYLLLQAATICKGGEVFVLDMGNPIKVLDLAKMLIQLYGFTPEKDIDITFTGLRPGERLFETLFSKKEKIETTAYPKILMAVNGVPGNARLDGINKAIGSIKVAISKGDLDEALMVVKDLVPSYAPKVCKRYAGEIGAISLTNENRKVLPFPTRQESKLQ